MPQAIRQSSEAAAGTVHEYFPPFRSILSDESETERDADGRRMPEFFTDLNLDLVAASITAGFEEYNLKPFFYAPLSHRRTIHYRHDILRDLESQDLLGHIRLFAQGLRTMRSHLAQADKLHYRRQKESWFLDTVALYCDAVTDLDRNLTLTEIRSRGFLAFREFLATYTRSEEFVTLSAETRKLKADLSRIRYCLRMEGKRIEVDRYDSEPDYGAEVSRVFDEFKHGSTKDYRFDFSAGLEMNHVEAAILDLVARLHPEVFSSLDEYCSRHQSYLNGTIARFDREVHFYVACLEYIERFKDSGLRFCLPSILDRPKEIYGREIFDLALADSLIRENAPVVTNDFHLRDPERIFVVTGPNQGGKTTFARTFGQLHYLASIGCPVPGREANLYLFDGLYTHFERVEHIQNLSGKLEADLLGIYRILERATSRSILIMNESFLSTTLSDALFLSTQIMQEIIRRDMLCVSVTFLDELASFSNATVSLVSTVSPEDPERRTFKIIRKPADGLAYAAAIAKKYRLGYNDVKERIVP